MTAVDLAVARIIEESKDEPRVPRLYSARGIAARCELSRMQVYRAHHAGRLPGYRLLGTLRFLESDLLRLLREEGVPLREETK